MSASYPELGHVSHEFFSLFESGMALETIISVTWVLVGIKTCPQQHAGIGLIYYLQVYITSSSEQCGIPSVCK